MQKPKHWKNNKKQPMKLKENNNKKNPIRINWWDFSLHNNKQLKKIIKKYE